MATLGFIGLGNMGGPMVRNLVKAGHDVKAFDLSPDAMNFAVQAGARAASSVADAAGGVAFVVTMLPVGQNVRDVYLGPDGAIAAADPGTVLLDSSTIDVETAQAVHAAAAEAGLEMLDAPVSGGTGGAEAGTLTFMCGGDKAVFEKARAVLSGMGKNLVLAGGPGLGQAAKICNNMVAGITNIAVCEAFVLGEKLGLDHQVLFDIMSTSSASCFSLLHACPVPGPVPTSPANRDYQPGFAAALMLKDLRLAQAASQMSGAATPLGAEAAALYALFCNAGNGGMDTTAMIKLIRGER